MSPATVAFNPATVDFGAPAGLVPGVVQDRADGRVLMVGYLDAEALAATLATGEVHFHSRSRGTLWRKGETSGNVLELRSIEVDCDGDALLLTVDPVGPTCHRGTRSCFDPVNGTTDDEADRPSERHSAAATAAAPAVQATESPTAQGFAWLETLWATIADRVATRPAGSYTAQLLDGGVDAVGRKVTEEATEVLLAAKDDAAAEAAGLPRDATRTALAGEAADLVYHSLVLLAERDLAPRAVIAALAARHAD
jgi:phosphoribosyl-AMP cyclohydrolase / phosphoribosyl-ATP pyrophosphohydrolase